MAAGMALQLAVYAAERGHTAPGQKALFDQVHVEHRRGVPLAEHKAVTVGVVGLVRADVHPLLVEQRQDLADG